MSNASVKMYHTYREGKNLADFIANHAFSFIGIDSIHYSTIRYFPREAKAIIILDKKSQPKLGPGHDRKSQAHNGLETTLLS